MNPEVEELKLKIERLKLWYIEQKKKMDDKYYALQKLYHQECKKNVNKSFKSPSTYR